MDYYEGKLAMNILYMWIKEYGSIKNQGFVTTSEYNIKGELIGSDNEMDNDKFSLYIEKNENYIKEFFRLDQSPRNNVRISDITAIIGENGTGKSTFLNFIKNNLVDGAGGIQFPAVIMVKDGDQNVIYHDKSIDINVIKNDIKIQIISYDQKLDFSHMKESRNTSFIFYSNVFDYARGENQWGDNYNISTNYLIHNYKNDGVEMKYYDVGISEVTVFRYKEIKRQIDFVRSYKDSIKFKLPDKVSISINSLILRRAIMKDRSSVYLNSNYDHFIDEDETKYDKYYPLIKYVHNQLNILEINSTDPVVRFKCDWYMAIFNGFFHNYNLLLNPEVDLYDMLTKCGIINNSKEECYFNSKDFEGANIIEKVLIFFKKLVSVYENEKEDFRVQSIQSIIKTISFINNAIDKGKFSAYSNSIILETDNSELSIFKFIDAYDDAFSLRPIIEFDWIDRSSGEKAQLSMFSRFFSIVKDKKNYLKDKIIILIDEGELYYHPQWQKEFIKNLIDLFEKIYGENNRKREIQIILTSNSPFIVSDLPTKNIVFLKKENGYCKVVDGLEENIYTFGANIHTLLSDSFYMKEGLMGSFAKQKIDSIIRKVLNGTSVELKEKTHEIESIISMIGEPIIRNKLQKMVRDRIEQKEEHNMDYCKLVEKVSLLEMEIELLKKSKS